SLSPSSPNFRRTLFVLISIYRVLKSLLFCFPLVFNLCSSASTSSVELVLSLSTYSLRNESVSRVIVSSIGFNDSKIFCNCTSSLHFSNSFSFCLNPLIVNNSLFTFVTLFNSISFFLNANSTSFSFSRSFSSLFFNSFSSTMTRSFWFSNLKTLASKYSSGIRRTFLKTYSSSLSKFLSTEFSKSDSNLATPLLISSP
ncbi:hypothetical protein AWRI1631_10260, partial [Saccharomyces cerevisiae AWRI1631]